MNVVRIVKRMIAPGLLFLVAATLPAENQSQNQNQNAPLSPAQIPHTAKRAPSRPKQKAVPVQDNLAGLTLTEEQQAKIDQIHQETKAKMDVVVNDGALDRAQKGAMLEGLERMDGRQVLKVLTSEQLEVIRKKELARRAAALEAEKKQQDQPPKEPGNP